MSEYLSNLMLVGAWIASLAAIIAAGGLALGAFVDDSPFPQRPVLWCLGTATVAISYLVTFG